MTDPSPHYIVSLPPMLSYVIPSGVTDLYLPLERGRGPTSVSYGIWVETVE